MEAVIVSDYFYGEESEQFSYFRIPRLLVRSKKFKTLSTDAKLLYGLMLDRMGLSAKHGWYDDLGRVYIYYTLDEIQTDLMCGHNKAVRLLAELDTGKDRLRPDRAREAGARPSGKDLRQKIRHDRCARSSPFCAYFRLPGFGNADFPKTNFQTSAFGKSRLPKTGSKLS